MKRRQFIRLTGFGTSGAFLTNSMPLLLISNTIEKRSIFDWGFYVDDLDQVRSNVKPTSFHLMRFFGKETKAIFGDDYYLKLQKNDKNDIYSATEAFANITSVYEQRKRQSDISTSILKGNDELIKGAMAVGFGLAPVTGGSSLIISSVAYVADKSLSKVEDMFAESARNEIRRNLKNQLIIYQKNASKAEYRKLLKAPDPATFRKELERRTEPILAGALDDISPEDQYIVNSFYNKELSILMNEGFSTLNRVQLLHSGEIQKNKNNIVGLSRIFIQYAEKNQKQLNHILQSQVEINNNLEELNTKVGKTEKGIEFIQEQMFGKMTPTEQIAALKSGIFPNMSVDERTELNAKIQIVQRREDLSKSVSNFLDGASQMILIANNLGVSGEIVNKVKDVVTVGNQAFSAFTAFSSGNYLACAGVISGMFGKGGRDIAGERHKQVINAINKVYDKVVVIENKIDILYKEIIEIKETQKIIYKAIEELSNKIQQNFIHVFEELEKIRKDIFYNRRIINAKYEQEYQACQNLLKNPSSKKNIIDTAQNMYPNYVAITELFRDFLPSFKDCDSRMRATELNDSFHPVLLIETYLSTPESDIEKYLTNVYSPAFDLLKSNLNLPMIEVDQNLRNFTFEERVSSLMSPVNTVSKLEKKIPYVTSVQQHFLPFEKVMKDMLAPEIVASHCEYILNVHFYYPFLTPTNDSLLPYNLVITQDIRKAGYYALLKALSVTDIAIAQQSMLSGDALLPVLYIVYGKQFKSPSIADIYYLDKMKLLLSSNSILVENFITYSLRVEVLSLSNFLFYNIALGTNNPELLKKCTILPWDFHYSNIDIIMNDVINQHKGWSIKLYGKFFKLPDGDSLLAGKFIHQKDLLSLLSLRFRLLEEIAGYEILDSSLLTKDRLKFNEIILNSI